MYFCSLCSSHHSLSIYGVVACLSRSFLLFPKAFQVPLGAFLDRTHLLVLQALLDYGLRPLAALLDRTHLPVWRALLDYGLRPLVAFLD